MASEANQVVLRMVNHIDDKSIEALASHITGTKKDIYSLRGSDLRSLSSYIFNIELDERGFLSEVGHGFSNKISGSYSQHITTLSAIESRFKRDAPDMVDQASMDIRIVRNTVIQVYKWLCQLYSLQETMEQPLLADSESNIPLDNAEDLNPFQVLLLDMLSELERQKLRRTKDMVCREMITEKGHRTMSWEPECSIMEKIHSLCDKNTMPDRWKLFTKRASMPKEISTYLEQCVDVQFPELIKNRHAWSFNNGIFVGDLHVNKFYPYGSEDYSKLDRHMVTSKFFSKNFTDYTNTSSWSDIPTPYLESIMNYQGWSEEVKKWMYIMLGRLTFAVNEADGWQVIPFCKGIAQSGKSTLLNHVAKLFYVPSDISVMANNIEEKFGLSSIYKSNLFIGPEIKGDFKIDQAEFQSLISGEEIQIARKGKSAVTTQWNVPGILAGNETPGFSDNSGSILRRLMLFKFAKQVDKGDARLGDKLADEIDVILQKCTRAYCEAVKKYSSELIWNVVPKQFHAWRKEIEGQLHTLVGFMETPQLKYGEDKMMPLSWFRTKYRNYCSSLGIKARPWKIELYEGPFSQRNLVLGVGTIEWRGEIRKDQEIVYGVTIEENNEDE